MMLLLVWLWVWQWAGHSGHAHASVPQSEIDFLYSLYNLTHGDQWLWRSNGGPIWNFTIYSEVNPCNTGGLPWQGITCSSNPPSCSQISCSVVKIDLERYGLRDQLPLQWRNLNSLTHLDLSDNYLTGYFPQLLPQSLNFLDLSDNQLTNSIPLTFGYLTNLAYLDLESNLLSLSLPSTIVYLTSLTYFVIYKNRFNGPLPTNIGQMISLKHIDFEDNYFSGKIPTSFGNLKYLSYFDLSVNFFTHTIPEEVGLISPLVFFSVEVNRMTGSIPSTIGYLTTLDTLQLEENFFTGGIPSEIGLLSRLNNLQLFLNSFGGTLPSTLSSLTSLTFLELSANSFSGSILRMSSLSELRIFTAFSNFFTSTLPCDLVSLSKLTYLDLSYNYLDGFCDQILLPSKLERFEISYNYLQGSIPTSLFTNLVQVDYLDISDNLLTGRIPTNIHRMTRLGNFDAARNHLTGGLPSSIASLTQLIQLYLPENHLDGSLDALLSSARNMSLVSLDLNSNMFEGAIPEMLFEMSELKVLALTSNCFHGSIPSSICQGRNLQVISMDGLGAASGCANRNLVSGNIPQCMWSLQNLSVLSFSGNGLTGTLSSSPPNPNLLNLTLSHNHLSGVVPPSLLSRSYGHLDLSYNKFRGEFRHDDSDTPKASSHRLILEVNRLSGSLSGSNFSDIDDLNILTGNIFACDTIPKDDANSNSYSCGSLMLDEAIFSSCIVIGCGIFCYCIYHSLFRLKVVRDQESWLSDLSDYFLILGDVALHVISKELQKLNTSMNYLQYLGKITMVIVCCCLILPLPAYGLRWSNSSEYSTHDHLYRWVSTTAYFTGRVPAVLLIISWMFAVTVFIYLVRRMKRASVNQMQSDISLSPSEFQTTETSITIDEWKQTLFDWLVTSLFIIINVAVIGTLNALYILSTTQQNSPVVDFWIKVCVAIFKVLWNAFYLPQLDYLKHSQRINIFIRVLNSILIPFIATGLSSPSCFQGVFVDADPVTSSYVVERCLNFSTGIRKTICTAYEFVTVYVAPFIPPFSYNYLCGSTLLAAYIPVYIYVYTIQLLLPFLSTYILCNYIPYSNLPSIIQRKLPGLLWPDYWSSQNTYQGDGIASSLVSKQRPTPLLLLRIDHIMTSHMQDFLLLLTFGLCCPLLAAVIGLSIFVSILHVRFIVGRFVLLRNPGLKSLRMRNSNSRSTISTSRTTSINVSKSDIGLVALTIVLSDLGRSYHQVLWVIVWNSCLFWSLLCWDIAGDEVGWYHSLWVPFLPIGYIALIRLAIYIGKKYLDGQSIPVRIENSEIILSNLHERETLDLEEQHEYHEGLSLELGHANKD